MELIHLVLDGAPCDLRHADFSVIEVTMKLMRSSLPRLRFKDLVKRLRFVYDDINEIEI